MNSFRIKRDPYLRGSIKQFLLENDIHHFKRLFLKGICDKKIIRYFNPILPRQSGRLEDDYLRQQERTFLVMLRYDKAQKEDFYHLFEQIEKYMGKCRLRCEWNHILNNRLSKYEINFILQDPRHVYNYIFDLSDISEDYQIAVESDNELHSLSIAFQIQIYHYLISLKRKVNNSIKIKSRDAALQIYWRYYYRYEQLELFYKQEKEREYQKQLNNQ